MKTTTFVPALLPAVGRRSGNTILTLLWLFSAAGPATTVRAAQESDAIELDVGVRSYVDKPVSGFKNKPAPEHGKVYQIAQLHELRADDKLVRQVDERGMLKTLREELAGRGFRERAKGQAPDIFLTVDYGRGYLTNPFTAASSMNDLAGDLQGMPEQTIRASDANAMDLLLKMHFQPGYEAKIQKAQFEKLYIRVTAWQNPPPAPGKFKMLWKTTMVVDDPDHRDLNNVYKEMLAAGSGYFDREAKEPEVDVYKPVPEGHVKLGPTEVIEEPKAKSP